VLLLLLLLVVVVLLRISLNARRCACCVAILFSSAAEPFGGSRSHTFLAPLLAGRTLSGSLRGAAAISLLRASTIAAPGLQQ
jgi:hypothetical protein